MTIIASASRAAQEPAALAIPVTGPGSGWAFTDRPDKSGRHPRGGIGVSADRSWPEQPSFLVWLYV
jgi:hypothetical protein